LSQIPFPLLKSNSSQENALWWIPIAMTDGKQPDFSKKGTYPRVWLTPERPTLDIPYNFPSASKEKDKEEDTWILINSQFSSYSRVLYDKSNWRLISNQLMLNHTVIPKVTRAQLIDDAFTLALAGYLDYQVVVELIEYLTLVNDEFVRTTSLFHLKVIQERSRHNESLYHLFEVCHKSDQVIIFYFYLSVKNRNTQVDSNSRERKMENRAITTIIWSELVIHWTELAALTGVTVSVSIKSCVFFMLKWTAQLLLRRRSIFLNGCLRL
jgi:hypothetical protein